MDDTLSMTKILSPADAEFFCRDGWKAADLHAHTLYSADVIPVPSLRPVALYQEAIENGMDFVTFTDHDTMASYQVSVLSGEGLVRGAEIMIKDIEAVGHTIHVNVYELDNNQFQDLERIAGQGDIYRFLDFLKEEDLPFVYNHPLWFKSGEKPNYAAIPDLIRLFPVIEYNMHRVRRENELVVELARKYKKGLIASTDTHSGMIGKAYTLSKGEDFRDFYQNICLGRSYIVVKDMTKQSLMHEMNIWLNLLSSQDRMLIEKRINTGMSYLDEFIAVLTSNSLKDFPRLYRAAISTAHKIAGSGLPAAIYIRKEISEICKIEESLGINPAYMSK